MRLFLRLINGLKNTWVSGIAGITKGGSFTRKASLVMSGTLAAQLISLAAHPVYTRLFTQDDFGLISVFIAMAAILYPLVIWGFESAIFVENDDNKLKKIVGLGVVMVAILAPGLGYAALLLMQHFEWQDAGLIAQWQYVALLYIALFAFVEFVTSLVVRLGFLKIYATTRVAKSLVIAGTSVVLGLLQVTENGMFVGLVIGTLSLAFYKVGLLFFYKLIQLPTIHEIKGIFVRYKNFPRYQAPANLLNEASMHLPAFLLAYLYSLEVAGLYFLALKILGQPIYLISNSVLAVYKEKASALIRAGNSTRPLFSKTFYALSSIGVVPFFLIVFSGPFVFEVVFGQAWRESGVYAQILAPMFFLNFVVTPLSYTVILVEKQKLYLFWQIAFLLSWVVCLVAFDDSVRTALLMVTVLHCVLHLSLLFVSFRVQKT